MKRMKKLGHGGCSWIEGSRDLRVERRGEREAGKEGGEYQVEMEGAWGGYTWSMKQV
jgi:hypothetical protein